MKETFNKELIEFIAFALQNKNTDLASNFESKFKGQSFDGENQNSIMLLVVKAFDPDFSQLIPLANYLLDNNYCKVDKQLISYAMLQGVQLEIHLKELKRRESKMNEDFDFVNQISGASFVFTNEPMEKYLKFSKHIVSNASHEEIEAAKNEIFAGNEKLRELECFNIFNKDNSKNENTNGNLDSVENSSKRKIKP